MRSDDEALREPALRDGARGPRTSPGAKLLLVAVVAGLTGAGGVWAATTIRSPQQQRADAAAPAPTVLTAPVVRQRLRDAVTIEARLGRAASIDVAAPDVDVPRQVVSAQPFAVGDTVRPGDVLLEVSGRPLLVLIGDVPLYRDLRLGDQGGDVAQLQRALTSAGHPVRADGIFGTFTDAALRALYAAEGYEPPGSDIADGPRADAPGAEPGPQGVTASVSELVLVPSLPATVSALPAPLGRAVSGPVAQLSYGALVARGRLNRADAALAHEGAVATIRVGKQRLHGRVTRMGSSDGAMVDVTLTVTDDASAGLTGRRATVTFVRDRSDGAVLTVPLTAITRRADGTDTVTLRRHGEQATTVVVTTGMTADGYVEVADEGGILRDGDPVVVGGSGPVRLDPAAGSEPSLPLPRR